MRMQVKCWELFECKKKECPVYETKEPRCWLVSGTLCRDEIQGAFLQKIETCLACEVFRTNIFSSLEDTVSLLIQQFAESRGMVEERERDLEKINMELTVGLSEVSEALNKISSGDPSVKIPETSGLKVIAKLKHMVNLAGKDIAEMVDLSHEFAIGLAEHFDAMHRVSKGDLAARVSGTSPVELLESLKKVTNQMIESVSREITSRKRAEERMRRMNSLKTELLISGSLRKKLKRITDSVVEMIGADFCRIWITKPGDLCDSGCFHATVTEGPHVCRYRDHCLHLMSSSGRYTHIDGGHRRVPFGCYRIGRIASGKVSKYVTNDVTHDPEVHDHDWARGLGLVSCAGYQLLSAEGIPVGVLALFSKHAISPEDDIMFEGLANTTAQVIQTVMAEEALKEYSERLEEKVDERTKELRDAHEQLVRREKLATLGQLAGGLGHELRNPLGAIKNAIYLLNMVVEDPESEVKETIDIIEKEVGVSERIITSLLDFARPRPPSRHMVDINDVVQEAVSRVPVPENVEVVRQLSETLATIPADPTQLTQVFGNLALNAVQAMPDGGRLMVRSEAPSPEWVTVSFIDTGVGIDEETLPKVLEPLFTTKARGIGLGLALTKMLVEAHGGSIDVESELGKGTTFTVNLPVGKNKQE